MSKVYVSNKLRYLEPMEAIIDLYNSGCSLQKIVNVFLDSKVRGYNLDRVKSLIRKYKELLEAGEFEHYSDVELDEDECDFVDGAHEEDSVYISCKLRYEYVVNAIIYWYEKGVSISSMLETIKEAGIRSYSTSRIQNLIKIYKRLKKAGEYEKPIDVELEEGMPQKAAKSAAPAKTAKSAQASKSLKKKSSVSCKEMADDDDFDAVIPGDSNIVISDIESATDGDELTDDDELLANCDDEESDLSDPRFHTEEEIEKIVDDPLPIFRELNNHVMMVGQRLTAALLVTGPGGIGKSYAVTRVLSEFGTEKKDFVVMKGKCTACAMYDFLFRNHDKICVFDDCDSVLCDKEGLAVLKGALDSGKDREISWNTRGVDMVDTFNCQNRRQVVEKLAKWSKSHGGRKGVPTHFQFEGSVIFISNMSRQEIKAKDAALLTRCSVVDISINKEEFLERLNALLPDFKIYDARGKSIAEERMKEEVYEWISSDEFLNHPKMLDNNLDFRMFIKAYKARYAKIPMWKEMSFAS